MMVETLQTNVPLPLLCPLSSHISTFDGLCYFSSPTCADSSSSFVGGGSLFAFCDSDIGTAEEKVHISHSTFVYNQAFSNLDNMLNSYIGGGAMYGMTPIRSWQYPCWLPLLPLACIT